MTRPPCQRIDQDRTAAEAAARAAQDAKIQATAAAQAEKDAKKRDAQMQRMEEQLRRDAEKHEQARSRSHRTALDSFLCSAGGMLGREITRSVFCTRRR